MRRINCLAKIAYIWLQNMIASTQPQPSKHSWNMKSFYDSSNSTLVTPANRRKQSSSNCCLLKNRKANSILLLYSHWSLCLILARNNRTWRRKSQPSRINRMYLKENKYNKKMRNRSMKITLQSSKMALKN